MLSLQLGSTLAQTRAAVAQSAPPEDPKRTCDMAAASPLDKQRPSDVPAVAYNALKSGVAIPACEAAVRAAPDDLRVSYQLARAYRRAKRLTEALPLFQQLAQKGNALAAHDLATIYQKGEGVPVDLKAQAYYLEQASRAGLGVAAYELGSLYRTGNAVVPKDEKIARQWMYFATNDSFAPAMREVGMMLADGVGGNKDDVEARSWFEKSAQAGNAAAMNDLGTFFQSGRGGAKDLDEARKWYQKAANGNSPNGTNNLGWMFEHGLGGPQDLEEAHRLYRKAIVLGETKSAEKNLERLERITAASTEAPRKEAETPPAESPPNEAPAKEAPPSASGADDVEARARFEKAAHAGNTAAMNSLGVLFQTGRGGATDMVQARKWFQKAANGRNPDGTNNLGWMFEHGLGGPQDLEEAHRLYRRAIVLGETTYAEKNLERLDRIAAAPSEPSPPETPPPGAPTKEAPPPEPPPNVAQTEPPTRACDLAAASPYDKQRPADVPAVAYTALDPSTVIPACEAAVRAAPEDARMSYQLARGYRRAGRLPEALRLFRQLAQKSYALADNDLATMYKKGEGVPVDLKAQVYYLEQAARAGFATAGYDLGLIYGNGNAVVPQDEKIARQWLYFATNDNFAPAMFAVGVMLERGKGGKRDDAEARSWYEKAANAGIYSAMTNLGYFIEMGRGGPKDLAQARSWYEKAAGGSDAMGTNNLGMMFQQGLGGPRDLDEARRLYKKAIELGEKVYAAKNLAKLDRAGAAPQLDPGRPIPTPPASGGTVCERFPNLC